MVTGATGGLGYEIALALAQGCADVIVAGRNEAKGRSAADRIRSLAPRALVRFEKVDLANLASTAAFAGRIAALRRPLDLLVNNAGVMALPQQSFTADGFELQWGTNFLGHFALTALLLPQMRRSKQPRVVQMSSLAHRSGKIRFDDLDGKRRYRPWAAYSQSKLAMLMFALELQRQSDAHGWGLFSLAAHPGYAQTDLFANGLGAGSFLSRLSRSMGRTVSQSAAAGAQPALYAASACDVKPGGYYGPNGLFELAGPPAEAHVARRANDRFVARKLWQVAERLTGVRWPTDESKKTLTIH